MFLDEDFSVIGGTSQIVFFGPFEMSKQIIVTSLHDDIGEGDEVIILDLITDIIGNTITVNSIQQSTRITIVEDDSKSILCALQDRKVYS